MKKIFDWRKNFFIILAINFIAIALVPLFIRRPIFGLSQSFVIFLITLILLIAAYIVNALYLKELRRLRVYQLNLEDRLQETFKYIGSVNLQMEEMKQSFSGFKKYPQNKKDIKTAFNYFAEKILSAINVDWVIFRVIDTNTLYSLRDERYTRAKRKVEFERFENKDILKDNYKKEEHTIVYSDQVGFYLKTCCILPGSLDNNDQEFFVKSLVNQLEMLFIIFSSLEKNKNRNTELKNHE
ncbi:MAG: hypothetical protein EOM88_02795 [Clostridia bacterium]|nr:hypothetical protein [Clostridia bacterium]